EIEDYIRRRMAELSPQARAGIFHVALNQPHGVITISNFRLRIYKEILSGLEDEATRETFLDLWIAGIETLPEPLRSVVLSIAYSESGSTGSPEQAMVTLFRNMGPLIQKLGQTLALDPNLPESFRSELSQLWDEAQKLKWWEAWELIHAQYGDIEASGYYLSRIMNAGTTEATLEITHKETGRKFVMSVYRDGVKRSVMTDTTDLRTFAEILTARNPEKYSFLNLLVEDSIETIGPELDRDHKRRAAEAMVEIYAETAQALGGSVDANGYIAYKGFTIYNPRYTTLELIGGKQIHAQELADGIPLKQLKELDPAEYLRVSEMLIEFENAALKRGEWIDKDRMPGQYIYDPATKTVSILDHGQGRKIHPEVHQGFERFMSLLFIDRPTEAIELFSELTGLEVQDELVETLAEKAATLDVAVRPLQILQDLSSLALTLDKTDERRVRFFDLVHAVRAKLRLAHWESGLGLDIVRSDLRRAAFRNMPFWQKARAVVESISSHLFGREEPTASEQVPQEEALPTQGTASEAQSNQSEGGDISEDVAAVSPDESGELSEEEKMVAEEAAVNEEAQLRFMDIPFAGTDAFGRTFNTGSSSQCARELHHSELRDRVRDHRENMREADRLVEEHLRRARKGGSF
ncbi:MAG: AarF/UbiB family protein, partial [Pseudomonadota bacterium]